MKFRTSKCSGFHCQVDHTDSTKKWPRNVYNISEIANLDELRRAQTHGLYFRISQSALVFVSACFFPDDLILQPSPTACVWKFFSREIWRPERTVVPVKKFNIYIHNWIRRRLELQYSDIGLVFVGYFVICWISVTSRHPHNRQCLYVYYWLIYLTCMPTQSLVYYLIVLRLRVLLGSIFSSVKQLPVFSL